MKKQLSEKETEHHNIPQSVGGSHEEVNITILPESRHSDYHQWASNRAPCLLSRLMTLKSIGIDGQSVSPEDLNILFQIVTRRDWNLLYEPFAVRNLIMPNAVKYARKVAEFSIQHLTEEREEIRRVLEILSATNPNIKPGDFVRHYSKFFKSNNPGDALEKLCTERHDDELCWTKPMQNETRRHIIILAKHMDMISLGKLDREEMKVVLNKELGIVSRHIVEWQRELEPFENGNGNSDKKK